ncbi:MAG: hypothetical protein QOH75_3909 [Actinomycetota bacterium]|nr:hypothetical protein [Actinomycetota bacterium]
MTDPRAAALGTYLRARAATFSMAADTSDDEQLGRAGMALLDAATTAECMLTNDPVLRRLSEAGLFECLADDQVALVETAAVRAAVQRPILGAPMTGREVLDLLVVAALGRS